MVFINVGLDVHFLFSWQINPFQASMVLFVGKAWGAVTDPIVGFFITKSKWTKIGRLMPWWVAYENWWMKQCLKVHLLFFSC